MIAVKYNGREEMPPPVLARLAAAAVILGPLAGAALAQDKWPTRPVTIIVPFAAGGNTDVMARIFSEHDSSSSSRTGLELAASPDSTA